MKRTHLPLNGLRVLDAAARHLSFTRAADELAVTPAAVGQQIRALEDTLGVVLFRRTTRGLELTPEAEAGLAPLRAGFLQFEEAVRAMLGSIDQDYLFKLLEFLAAQDIKGMLGVADEMEARSLSFDGALQDLSSLLHQLALAQSAPDALGKDMPDRERILALAGSFDAEELQLYYQITLHGRRDLSLAPDEYAGFTMSLMRMLAFRPVEIGGVAAPAPVPAKKKSEAPASVAAVAPLRSPAAASAAPAGGGTFDGDWPALAERLAVKGIARQLAQQSELRSFDGESMELSLAAAHRHLADKGYQEKLRAALQEYFGRTIALKISIGEVKGVTAAAKAQGERQARQEKAVEAIHGDPFVRDMMETLDATIVSDSVKPSQ